MKNILLYILFFCAFNVFAQNKDSLVNVLNNHFERAEKELKDNSIHLALGMYHFIIYKLDKYQLNDSATTHLRTISIKRADSLFPIVLNENFKRLKKGKWKLKQLKDNEIYAYKYIEITENKILFYDKKLKAPSRVEEIVYPLYEDLRKLSPSAFSIYEIGVKFKNGEIWSFNWDGESTGGEIKYFLYPFLSRLEDGTEAEHRYSIDSVRKKDVTYYILIK